LDDLDKKLCYIAGVSQNVKELEANLNRVYKSTCGVEFDHASSVAEQAWLFNNFEKAILSDISENKRK
jgi:2-oxoglutarate dehydrogenase complex dehydrogenase (E1) component-like enzyme